MQHTPTGAAHWIWQVGTSNILARVTYHLVGIAVAAFVVTYLFPLLMKRLNPRSTGVA